MNRALSAASIGPADAQLAKTTKAAATDAAALTRLPHIEGPKPRLIRPIGAGCGYN